MRGFGFFWGDRGFVANPGFTSAGGVLFSGFRALPSRGEPGGSSLFFASPKKSNQKKGDPQSGKFLGSESKFAEPFGSPGGCGACTAAKLASDPNNFNLRCSTPAGVRRTRCAQTTAALIPLTSALLSPARTGQSGAGSDSGSRTRKARPVGLLLLPPGEAWPVLSLPKGDEGSPIPNPFLHPFPNPSVCAEERKSRRIRDRACLSEASLHDTPAGLSTAGCPERSAGTQTVGSPFLWLLSFGEAKESDEPPGSPRPGSEGHRSGKRQPGSAPVHAAQAEATK